MANKLELYSPQLYRSYLLCEAVLCPLFDGAAILQKLASKDLVYNVFWRHAGLLSLFISDRKGVAPRR
jgi:hypothetical protein